MGPFSKIWAQLNKCQKQGGKHEVDLPTMLKDLEKGIICLEQVNVQLNYYRRVPIVSKIMDNDKKAQKILKKTSHEFKSKKLVGKKFQTIMQKTIKKKKEAKELKKSLIFTSYDNRKPF